MELVTHQNEVTKIDLIWDDRDAVNEGWYARLTLANGQERDHPLEGDRRAGLPSLLPQAMDEAAAWGWTVADDVAVEVVR